MQLCLVIIFLLTHLISTLDWLTNIPCGFFRWFSYWADPCCSCYDDNWNFDGCSSRPCGNGCSPDMLPSMVGSSAAYRCIGRSISGCIIFFLLLCVSFVKNWVFFSTLPLLVEIYMFFHPCARLSRKPSKVLLHVFLYWFTHNFYIMYSLTISI